MAVLLSTFGTIGGHSAATEIGETEGENIIKTSTRLLGGRCLERMMTRGSRADPRHQRHNRSPYPALGVVFEPVMGLLSWEEKKHAKIM